MNSISTIFHGIVFLLIIFSSLNGMLFFSVSISSGSRFRRWPKSIRREVLYEQCLAFFPEEIMIKGNASALVAVALNLRLKESHFIRCLFIYYLSLTSLHILVIDFIWEALFCPETLATWMQRRRQKNFQKNAEVNEKKKTENSTIKPLPGGEGETTEKKTKK